MQIPAPGGAFELIQKEFPEPGAGHVRIRVQACGVCHSDAITKFAAFPGIEYPRVPGHEVAGVVDAVGADVPLFKPGQRVGLGWHGGHCNYCDHAGGATSFFARISRSPVSVSTAAMPTT